MISLLFTLDDIGLRLEYRIESNSTTKQDKPAGPVLPILSRINHYYYYFY